MDQIIDEYQNGMSSVKLAKKYNCSSSAIGRRLKRRGVNLTKRIDLPVQQIINEYRSGISTTKLAMKYNCSSPTISKLLKKYNINVTNRIDLPMKDIIYDYENGMSINKITNKYTCDVSTIITRFGEYNIHIRSRKESLNIISNNICINCGNEYEGTPTSQLCPNCNNTGYCYKFNSNCKKRNHEKYNNRCFFCNISEDENDRKHDTHHVDYNKNQGCNEIPDWILIPLCKSCHGMTGGDIDNRKLWEARILYLLNDMK